MGSFKISIADLPDEERELYVAREQAQANAADFVFRIAEMILVCGAAVFIERRLGALPIASIFLSAALGIYARSQATAGMLTLTRYHDLSPARQRLAFWLVNFLAVLLFVAVLGLITFAVPRIADVQA